MRGTSVANLTGDVPLTREQRARVLIDAQLRAAGRRVCHASDVTWLKDDSLEDLDNLPAPEIIAREIVEDVTAALVEFEAMVAALEASVGTGGTA